jgi:hypothetical protein
MPYRVTIEYTDDNVSVTFAGDCAGLWGRYTGTRMDSNAWLLAGRSAMERRWAEVHGVELAVAGQVPWDNGSHYDLLEEATYRWICEECPLAALAAMCAEWGAPHA